MATIEYKQVEVKLEDDDFECLVDTAGYGIAYWCDRALVDDTTYTVHHPEQENTREEQEDRFTTVLEAKDYEAAWCLLVTGQIQVADYIVGYLRSGDLGDVDSIAADVLTQVACFGEVVFG